MTKFVTGCAVVLAGALAAPASSLAATSPRFADHTIVVDKSIGGLSLGASPAAARRVFGAHQCSPAGCNYSSAGGDSAGAMFAKRTRHGRTFVGQLSISEARPGASSLSSLRTSAGIGLGSTARQLRRAYPRASGSLKTGVFVIRGGPMLSTVFSLASGRVTSITMQSIRFG